MSENQNSPNIEGQSNLAFSGIKHALDSFKDAPANLKGIVVILAIVSIVTLVVSIGLLTDSEDNNLALYSFIAFLFFAVLDIVLFYGVAQSRQDIVQGGVVVSPTWNRLVLAFPIKESTLSSLKSELTNLLNETFAYIASEKGALGITPSDLRANIFLPDYTKAGDGYVCWLEMHERLQVNMKGYTDERIRFRPGEGACGRVFVEEIPHFCYSKRERNGVYKWDDEYKLTPEQVRTIDDKLRWVLAVPLNVEDPVMRKRKPVGVLSIDGLNNSIDDPNFLNTMLARLFTKVSTQLSPLLSELPTVRLIVGVQANEHKKS